MATTVIKFGTISEDSSGDINVVGFTFSDDGGGNPDVLIAAIYSYLQSKLRIGEEELDTSSDTGDKFIPFKDFGKKYL